MEEFEMTSYFQVSLTDISNTLRGTGMEEAKREIMHHFRLFVDSDFDRYKKIWQAKDKIFDLEALGLVKCRDR